MQRNVCKIVEAPINSIALKARLDNNECGYLWKRTSADSNSKWQQKWFVLYQNFLFYYENVNSTKPSGLLLLEGCYCNRNVSNCKNTREGEIKLYCFTITYSKDGKNPVEFGAENEPECNQWIDAIKNCSYSRLLSRNAELHEKYQHLTQLYETESKSKWQFISQIEELSNEVKQLREELKRNQKQHHILKTKTIASEDSSDLKRIKKVQSLCRGWLYRRRWKQIVKDYIKSPLALSLKTRNRLVFTLIEREGEYMSQLEILVTNYLRPFKMAACSNKPIITHEEINCIFLNSEILLFLHQIFYKGLTKKLENWPTIFIGDLFDFLLPVLSIYQEYVRNHHYSLQILTELKSKSPEFQNLLKTYDNKPKCEGRTLDVFLTYPMHQIPRYILILHELITHSSQFNQNECKSLQNAKEKLEELSKIMHDEVSETENIRCNLAIEKLIVDRCDCLLDANQVFIREGLLIIITIAKSKTLGGKIKDIKKQTVVKCFLFSNHFIITTRASNGKLHLFKPYGIIPLNDVKVVEDVNDLSSIDEDNASILSEDFTAFTGSIMSDSNISLLANDKQTNYFTCGFQISFMKDSVNKCILLVASSLSEKQSWCSDISQCIDNLNYSTVLQNTTTSSEVNMPNVEKHSVDSKLFKDDNDVKYCKALNSCKVPQIRQASLEKLLERLVDLRFLSIDFLNTFLLTYRVFTNPYVVLETLIALYRSSSPINFSDSLDRDTDLPSFSNRLINPKFEMHSELNRRVSYTGTRLSSIDEEHDLRMFNRHIRFRSTPNDTTEGKKEKILEKIPSKTLQFSDASQKIRRSSFMPTSDDNRLAPIASFETIDGLSNSPTVPENLVTATDFLQINKSVTRSKSDLINDKKQDSKDRSSLLSVEKTLNSSKTFDQISEKISEKIDSKRIGFNDSDSSSASSISSLTSSFRERDEVVKDINSPKCLNTFSPTKSLPLNSTTSQLLTPKSKRPNHGTSIGSASQFVSFFQHNAQKLGKRLSDAIISPKLLMKTFENSTIKKSVGNVACGVVITSARPSRRRISNTGASKAFAIATSGSSSCETNTTTEPVVVPHVQAQKFDRLNSIGSTTQKSNDWVIVNTAASMRVLNVLRHWVTKHFSDFDHDIELKNRTKVLIEEMVSSNALTRTEQKVANSILQQLNNQENRKFEHTVNLDMLLKPPVISTRTKFSDLSVSEIAEQMTYVDYQIFCSIQSVELLGQAWMKSDKETKAPNVLIFSKRFNHISQLVVSEIVSSVTFDQRLEKLEKWITIANICRFLKNYNGVLQIMSAFATTSVFRLKKTWDKLSKTNQQTIELLQNLVSSDGRFKNLRDAMHKFDPPCIPYLGMYLMDLVFIEESTPDFTENNLVNFSKLRMISHIIRDIRSFQHTKYTIHYNRRVCEYLADTNGLLTPDEAYNISLALEPRRSRKKSMESEA